MHPLRCPYRGNVSALRASRGVHNNLLCLNGFMVQKFFLVYKSKYISLKLLVDEVKVWLIFQIKNQ